MDFPSYQEIQESAKKRKEPIDFNEAYIGEIENKQELVNLMAIVSGTRRSTSLELKKAINRLFYEIMVYRSSDRIQGTFLEYKMEERLDDLEKKLDATNNVVVQLVNWLTEEAKANDKMP